MIRKILFLTLALYLYSNSEAQIPDWDWAKSVGGTGDDNVSDICSDGNGNTIITGRFASPSITFGSITLTNNGGYDFYIVKYDINGNVVWAYSAGGSGHEIGCSISSDSKGNVYVIGYSTSSSINFGTINIITSGQSAFLLKYNASGSLIWAKSYFGAWGYTTPHSSEYALGITNDINDNIYITGQFTSDTIQFGAITLNNVDYSLDLFIVKINPLGEVIWAKSAGGYNDDWASSISTDKAGNVYILGNSQSAPMFFDSISIQNPYFSDVVFLTKYDPFGNLVWVRSGHSTSVCSGYNLTNDLNGNIIITGSFSGSYISFGLDTLTSPLTYAPDLFLVKFNPNGDLLWAKSPDGEGQEYMHGISIDNNNNIYFSGSINGPTNFGTVILDSVPDSYYDIFIVKYDSSGNDLWGTLLAGDGTGTGNFGLGIINDKIGNTFIIGNFRSQTLSMGSTNLSNLGDYDIMLAKLVSKGVFGFIYNDINENCFLDTNELSIKNRKAIINPGNIEIKTELTGSWYLDSLQIGNYTITYDTSNRWHSTCPTSQNFTITNTDSIIQVPNFGLKADFGFANGLVFQDNNINCAKDSNETFVSSVLGVINPGNIIVQSDSSGKWISDTLEVGNYTLTIDTSNYWLLSCPTIINIEISPFGSIDTNYQTGIISTQPCAAPEVSVNMPFMRSCFTNQLIYVKACNTNLATGVLINGYVELELDSLLTPTSSSIPFTSLGNNIYRFDVGTLNPGQCINFTVSTTLSCSAELGQTLCMQANLYPADNCVFDQNPTPPVGGVEPCTLPWDNSSLSVYGWCQNDTVYFSITNTGDFPNGNMQCYSPVRVFVDGVLTYLDSILLTGGQTIVFSYFGNGQTWTLQADQHPLHPGNSHPNASVEACGDSSNWTPGLINTLSLDDADPVVDIYCGVVTGSYDPNDKTGYPLGVGNDHFVAPNGKIDYVIRFQNTGTDTAFTVVVRDTLDVDLDIFSVQSGVSSHNYTFRMYGPRVLEWTFNNILLPDSTTDEPASNGFITFTVNQNPNLPDGTVINNSVGIYFDFNDPVITNTTTHTINRGINYLLAVNSINQPNNNSLFIYPNPTKNLLNIVVPDTQSLKIDVYTIDGKLIEQKNIHKNTAIDVSKYQSGLYFIHATNSKGEVFRNKFVKE